MTNPIKEFSAYELNHLLYHLNASQQIEIIHKILFLETPDGRNVWYEAKVASDMSSEYLDDILWAWELARRDMQIPLLLRYSLIISSQYSICNNISNTLLFALVEEKLIGPKQALFFVSKINVVQLKVEALSFICDHLHEGLYNQYFDLIMSLEDDLHKSQLFIKASKCFSGKYKKKALDLAVLYYSHIAELRERLPVLTSLIPILPLDQQTKIVNEIISVKDPELVIDTLLDVIQYIDRNLQRETINSIIDLTRSMKNKKLSSQVFGELLLCLGSSFPDDLLSSALMDFEEYKGVYDDAICRYILGLILVLRVHSALSQQYISRLIRISERITDYSLKAKILYCLSNLNVNDVPSQSRLQEECIVTINKISNTIEMVDVLIWMSEQDDNMFTEEIIKRLTTINYRLLSDEQKSEIIQKIMPVLRQRNGITIADTISSIRNKELYIGTIIQIAKYLDKNTRSLVSERILRIARNANEIRLQALAYVTLIELSIPRDSEKYIDAALEKIGQIKKDEGYKLKLMTIIVPYITEHFLTKYLSEK